MTKPLSNAETASKAIVDLSRIAMDKAPRKAQPSMYVAGVGALLTVLGMVTIAIIGTSSQFLWAFGAGIVLLFATLIALAFQERHRTGIVSDAVPILRGPIWDHFGEQMQQHALEDFLVHTFICPQKLPIVAPDAIDATSVLRLWADPSGSSISVHLVEEGGVKHFDIRFENSSKGWASNVTIRPGGLHPFQRRPNENFLCFEARVFSPLPKDHLKEVSLCFRIIDRLGTHWFHRQGGDLYFNEVIKDSEDPKTWRSVSIPLTDEKWQKFEHDGNFYYAKAQPDFKEMILALVIEVGSDRNHDRPGPGKGRVLIRNIRFSDTR